jgi:hypothetical protein
MLCSLAHKYQRFRGTRYLHRQAKDGGTMKVDVAGSSVTCIRIYQAARDI